MAELVAERAQALVATGLRATRALANDLQRLDQHRPQRPPDPPHMPRPTRHVVDMLRRDLCYIARQSASGEAPY